jgi:hypothetical protein
MAAHKVDALALQEAQLPPSPDISDAAEEEALEASAEEDLSVLPRCAMEKGHRSSWWRWASSRRRGESEARRSGGGGKARGGGGARCRGWLR